MHSSTWRCWCRRGGSSASCGFGGPDSQGRASSAPALQGFVEARELLAPAEAPQEPPGQPARASQGRSQDRCGRAASGRSGPQGQPDLRRPDQQGRGARLDAVLQPVPVPAAGQPLRADVDRAERPVQGETREEPLGSVQQQRRQQDTSPPSGSRIPIVAAPACAVQQAGRGCAICRIRQSGRAFPTTNRRR